MEMTDEMLAEYVEGKPELKSILSALIESRFLIPSDSFPKGFLCDGESKLPGNRKNHDERIRHGRIFIVFS